MSDMGCARAGLRGIAVLPWRAEKKLATYRVMAVSRAQRIRSRSPPTNAFTSKERQKASNSTLQSSTRAAIQGHWSSRDQIIEIS